MDDDVISIARERNPKIRLWHKLCWGRAPRRRDGELVELKREVCALHEMHKCPACGERDKFLIFKYVAVCMSCHEFYFIVMG
jgi:hypothetical protein